MSTANATATQRDLQQIIEDKIGQVRTDALDLSYGEIMSLHSADPKELIIDPDFQRYFRWTDEQQSRLIESILLELPVPQIFVIETQHGVLELIDGLQRVSTVMHFAQPELLPPPNNKPLVLAGCDLVKELNGLTFDKLPLGLRLRLKRSSVRACVIKRQSTSTLRYSMFKRLNTGGSALSAQEVRNCTSRMVGEQGEQFYKFLQKCAGADFYLTCTESLADRDQRQDEELVLRFFALKDFQDGFQGSIRDWLDDYMEAILLSGKAFDLVEQWKVFSSVFTFLARCLGRDAFVKFRDGVPTGGLAPAYFEAVSIGACRALSKLPFDFDAGAVRDAIVRAVQSDDFRDQVGPGANSKTKLEKRVSIVQSHLEALLK
jgi:hypothetical protein